jgi:hypothetical protein
MSLPYLKSFGWDAHVLAVQPNYVEMVQDPLLSETVPQGVPVTWVKALPVEYTRLLGIGNLGLRSLSFLLKAGDHLLRKQSFDLIYFSTTVFQTMILGPHWRNRFAIPYILDFQDLWWNDYYQENRIKPPGGYLKYGLSHLQAKWLEPWAMHHASHIVSVSPGYPKTLQQRYSHLSSMRYTVLPFGAPESDFEVLPSLNLQQHLFDPKDGKRHWVYVGRGGNDMALSLRALFLGLQTLRAQHPDQWELVHLHFVGTSYAPQGRTEKTIEPIAQDYGVADLVTEYPDRIPYFEALQVLVDSDAILLIGSDDPNYTASKLYPCVLARKPILAIFHDLSSVVDILHQCQAGRAITFHQQTNPTALLPEMSAQLTWLRSLPNNFQPKTLWPLFESHTAREMTHQQCKIFDLVVNTDIKKVPRYDTV